MKSNVEELSYKISYSEIYDMLKSYYLFSYDIEDVPKVFSVIDDDFYLTISEQFRSQLLAFAYILSTSKGYMSLYLYSFAISSLKDCFKHAISFIKCINSFDNSTQEEKYILIKSLDKIAQFCYDNCEFEYDKEKLFRVFYQYPDIDEDLIKRILKFNKKFNYKYIKIFLKDLLNFGRWHVCNGKLIF